MNRQWRIWVFVSACLTLSLPVRAETLDSTCSSDGIGNQKQSGTLNLAGSYRSTESNHIFYQPLDPYTMLKSSYTPVQVIPLDTSQRGDIQGLEYINSGIGGQPELWVLHENGQIGVKSQPDLAERTVLDSGITGATGLTQIPGGEIAVSYSNGIHYYDLNMNHKSSVNLGPININDIDWDSANNRMLIQTDTSLNYLDGNQLFLLSQGTIGRGIEWIDMPGGYYDMILRGGTFVRYDSTIIPQPYPTNLNGGGTVTGIGMTYNDTVTSLRNGLLRWGELATPDPLVTLNDLVIFHDYQNTDPEPPGSVPEPMTIIALSLGAVGLRVYASRRLR